MNPAAPTRPKTIFNRAVRAGLTSLLALTLGAGALSAQAQQPANQTSSRSLSTGFNAATPQALPSDLAAYVNDAAPELRALKTEFAKSPLGVSLLRYARDNDIRFVLDARLAGTAAAEYEPSDATIRVMPGAPLEAAVIRAAHELRHGWQDKSLGALELERGVLTPMQRWTLRRYMEADAEAFASYFEANRLQQGVEMQAGFAEAMPASNLAMRLRGEYWSRDGLTFGKYRRLAFEPALAALYRYDAQHLSLVERMEQDFTARAANAAGAQKTALSAAAQRAPDDAAFARFLRHFGGISFDVNAHTSLDSTAVPDDTLLRVYPVGGLPQDFAGALGQKIGALTAAHNAALKTLGVAPVRPPFRPGA